MECKIAYALYTFIGEFEAIQGGEAKEIEVRI
jgi:hypothetical protein